MKKLNFIIGMLVCVTLSVQAQKVKVVEKFELKPSKKIKVMILGTTHFNNPGRDVVNMKVEDVLQPKRQKEMEELTDLLAKFKPTKIMLEDTPKYDSLSNALYQRYLKGTHKLKRSEHQQIGYRLAKKLGHKRLYVVDHRGNFPMDIVSKYAKANKQYYLIEKALGLVEKEAKEKEKYLKNHLTDINRPEAIKENNGYYLSMFTKIGKNTNYVGTDLVVEWYKRNLKIYTNVLRYAEEGDRIFLMFGDGHVPILKHLFQDAIDFEYIEVNQYLNPSTKSK